MSKELVPEIHDILKLCESTKLDSGRPKSPHSHPHLAWEKAVKKNPALVNNLTWNGVCKHHHRRSFKKFPDTPELFLLDMADNLAAAMSRADIRKKFKLPRWEWDDKLFKLWKNLLDEVENKRQIRPLKFDQIIEFLKNNPTMEEYFTFVINSTEDYTLLSTRAEDAVIGANTTSLNVHSELTGKFYRILQKSGYSVSEGEVTTRNKLVATYNRKAECWELTVLKTRIYFSQKPVRLRDMYVFEALKEVRSKITKELNDYVFFNTSDELLLVLPVNEGVERLNPFLEKYGFWLEFVEEKQKVGEIHPRPDQGKNPKEGTLYPNLLSEITPQICEICQMSPATRQWPKDHFLTFKGICEGCKEYIKTSFPNVTIDYLCDKDRPEMMKWLEEKIVEDICEKCFQIREDAVSKKNLEKWDEDKEAKVIWIKVGLDFNELINTLGKLYARYIKDIKKDVEIRFSVLSEFQQDYDRFLAEFFKQLTDNFKDNMEEPILEDFFLIKIERLYEIIEVLRIYESLFDKFFPRFKDEEIEKSPIKIGISCSNVKFPFFEHWEMLRDWWQREERVSNYDSYINLIGKGEMTFNVKNLNEILLRAEIKDTTALHKLAEIARMSERLARITLHDKSGRDYKTYAKLRETLPHGLDYKSLLTFAKIVGDQSEVS